MAEYPLPKFHFKVTIGGDTELNCTEVSGLDFETEVIEYRGGADIDYFKKKQPGKKIWLIFYRATAKKNATLMA